MGATPKVSTIRSSRNKSDVEKRDAEGQLRDALEQLEALLSSAVLLCAMTRLTERGVVHLRHLILSAEEALSLTREKADRLIKLA
jgi:hypothetical protein